MLVHVVFLFALSRLGSAGLCPTTWLQGSLSTSMSADGLNLLVNTSGCPPYDWTSQSTSYNATVG